ncbi:hypothetical protein SAMN04487969_106208 [Paenibacillus algorifonticola]|uniref:Uncharacterized protein n=1 Tax=Paenibacillus algorifonticola TaxID=684063 RepID=A0A1I2DAU3_9BACL|nr:hypothetical protein SAMN04487969_106208 [Paenibacillus algorifonticola]
MHLMNKLCLWGIKATEYADDDERERLPEAIWIADWAAPKEQAVILAG